MRIAICDDHEAFRLELDSILCEYAKENGLVFTTESFTSGEALLAQIAKNQQAVNKDSTDMTQSGFDLIFLDIEMGGMNGIEVGEKISKDDTDCNIIYATGYSGYMRQAFAIHAFEYILKPPKKQELFNVLDEFIKRIYSKRKQELMTFKSDLGCFYLCAKDILYLEYIDKHRLKAVLSNGTQIFNSDLSDAFETVTKQTWHSFARPHKGFIVNNFHVKAILDCDLLLSNGDKIPLAQKRVKEFRLQYHEYLHRIAWL